MSTPLSLKDLRLASDAQDPELVPLLEALAVQPDQPPAVPVRDGAPTFDRFLAEIRSPRFRRKPPEDQAHYRIEQMKALESPDAEVPLADRLRLHEILFALWRDESPFARTSLLDLIAGVRLVYGPWRALKAIFKEAEAKGDTEVYGALAARFDMAHASGDHGVSPATLQYLVRRAWRFLRLTGVRLPVAYADTAADLLAPYTDDARWDGVWVANHVFFHETRQYNRRRFDFHPRPKSLIKDRAFPELWKRSPRPLFALLERARSDRVRRFAVEALRTDFRAVLRDVEPDWVARLVGLGSEALDEFVVWVLTNVPRFEQTAFRSLGLHDAVLRLLDSPSGEAQTYAANYARTHARDLPVPELVRLVDHSSQAVRKLAVDLLQSRDPRKEIGLEAWGWLLETTHGHELAAAALRQHFGPRELTPEWFKGRLFSPDPETFAFAQKLFPEIHPPERLGPGFFADLLDSLDATADPRKRVVDFAAKELERFDLAALDRGFLERLILRPATRGTVLAWVHAGRLKAAVYPIDFLKALAYRPAWEADPRVAEIRRGDSAWARALEFDDELAGRVLDWLGDVRQFPPAALGLDWLMRLVESSESRYHDFAVEIMVKGFTPADFAPREGPPAAADVRPTVVDLSGASFLFTGKMATMPRKDAESNVKAAGGVVASSVTKKLHYLVIGDEGSPFYSGGKKGDKQLKAEGFNAAGANIRIVSETAFLQMLAGGQPVAASADATQHGCECLWQMAVAPGVADARRGAFARKYILRHHPEIGPSQTDRPVDPGTEIPPDFLTFARVEPLFAETRKPIRDFALELARWEFARWKPSAEALLAMAELPHAEVRGLVAEALLADDSPEKRRLRIDPETLAPEALYRFCESGDAATRGLGIQIIQRSPRLQVPEELYRLTESPDRLVRGFVIRSLWALYRERGVTADWKPTIPPAPSLGAAAKKAAAQTEPRGPGVPHRPDQPPAGRPSLAALLRRVLFEIPPGRPEVAAGPAPATPRLKPLPAGKAKLALVEVMRDLALEDSAFASGVLPLLREFMAAGGRSERAACLVAVTRIRHTYPALRAPDGEAPQ